MTYIYRTQTTHTPVLEKTRTGNAQKILFSQCRILIADAGSNTHNTHPVLEKTRTGNTHWKLSPTIPKEKEDELMTTIGGPQNGPESLYKPCPSYTKQRKKENEHLQTLFHTQKSTSCKRPTKPLKHGLTHYFSAGSDVNNKTSSHWSYSFQTCMATTLSFCTRS